MAHDRPVRTAPGVADAEAIYRTHVRAIYAFVYGKVGNREAAEDITSEVFARALTRIDPAREERSIVAWLYRVARNSVVDYWRANGAAHVIAFEDALAVRSIPMASDPVRSQETAARAHALLARLPDNYRAVLSYRLLQGLSVAETARQMGISETNVKVLQHRALKRAADVGEDGEDDE